MENAAAVVPSESSVAQTVGGQEPAQEAQSPEGDERPRVLLVDDNNELRELLTDALGEVYAIDGATDGLEGLHRLMKEARSYDVVMTDLNMPHIDGIAFLDRVPEGIPVIVISAYLDRPEFARALWITPGRPAFWRSPSSSPTCVWQSLRRSRVRQQASRRKALKRSHRKRVRKQRQAQRHRPPDHQSSFGRNGREKDPAVFYAVYR
ncbi:MAG: hypothetical protein CME26_11660 [Gemmatimonadetes bacterium]|nr:hypothetical protein [Gemmatimonadota bacterium]